MISQDPSVMLVCPLHPFLTSPVRFAHRLMSLPESPRLPSFHGDTRTRWSIGNASCFGEMTVAERQAGSFQYGSNLTCPFQLPRSNAAPALYLSDVDIQHTEMLYILGEGV